MQPKTLITEVQRNQLLNNLIFGLLILVFTGILTWNQTIKIISERLLVLNKVLEVTLQEDQSTLAQYIPLGDRDKLRQLIEPEFQKIIRCYPREFSAGFYSRELDRVVVAISNYSNSNIQNLYSYALPPNDPGRKAWETHCSQYTFYWSNPRQTWLLKCDYPVIIKGKVIGHTFANITLSKMILLYFNMGLAVLVMVIIAGGLSFFTMSRTTRKIRKNAEQLLSVQSNPQFDYVEFQKIASELWINQKYRESILANFPWGYALINAQGVIIEFNDNGLAMLGFEREQVIGTRLKDWDENAPLLRAIDLKKPIFEETNFVFPNGEHKTYYTYSFPMTLLTGEEGAMAWFLDITERVNAKKIIEETNEKLTNILNSITDGFFILDYHWCFSYLNKAAEKLLGTRAAELLNQSIWDKFPAVADSLIYQEYQRAVTENVPVNFETILPPFGIWIEVYAYPSKEGLSIFFRDITERKLAGKTIQQLATIVETSEDAIISITLEGIISGWNQGAKKLYGYTAEEVIGKSTLIIVPEELHEKMHDKLKKLNQGQVYVDNHAVRVCKDGTLIYVSIKSSPIKDVTGKIVEISSIHRDITERVKYEEALAKERELLGVTLNSLLEGVIATDSEDRIFLINEAAINMTGYSQTEAVDEPLSKILYIIDDKTSEPIIDIKTLQHQKMPRQLILVTRDLKEVSISIHSSPIRSSQERIIGAVTVFQDITEKQKTEQELFKADKLESLGILAGGIAHDFNNLLAAILANVQLAQIKYRKNEDIAQYLNDTISSTRRASDLTKQLLTFSKGGAPVKRAASLADIIQDTTKFVLRGSKVKAEFVIPDMLWPIEVDTGQISQVIHNLVINAEQAMSKGGVIEISTENIVIEPEHRYNPGNYIKIMVKDQGIGIPKENLTKIFDPFFTTKNEGSGLGLSSAYSIIRQHDGYLEVESEVGKGTTFFIYLPALLETEVLIEPQKEVAVSREGLKILLMDDEEIILKSVGEMLEYFGHQVMLSNDGTKAIEVYKQALDSGVPFNVIIMDLTVPGGMGGQEAIAHLRDIDPKVKAIVSSGYANDPIMSDYERYGFCGVVTKPYKFDELCEVLNKVVERKQLVLKFNF